MLRSVTLVVNFLALAGAVWLGLYVVTRSPRRLISWLTGLTLWCLSGHFLNVLLALIPPPIPIGLPIWLSPFLHLWEANSLQGASSWLQGWMIAPTVVLWHHVTTLMRSAVLSPWQWARLAFGYGITAVAIVIQAKTPLVLSASPAGDPLYLSALEAGSFYPFLLALAVLYTAVSLTNLLQSAQAAPTVMPRRQLLILAGATIIAGFIAPVSVAGSILGLPVPIVVVSLLLGFAVVLIGYGVAQYSALVEGRTVRRDFYYSAIASGLTAVVYLLATWVSVQFFRVPATAYIFMILFAVVTHSLVDVARWKLDWIVYRGDLRQIQVNLHKLAEAADQPGRLDQILSMALESLCTPVRAIFGLLLLCEDRRSRLAASYRWHHGNLTLTGQELAADDVLELEPGYLKPPLAEAALLIPLYADTEQLGALVLGRPVNGVRYSQAEVDQLLYSSDRLADAIWDARWRAEKMVRVTEGIQTTSPTADKHPDQLSVKAVEDALRHLTDYAYLGDHSLTQLKLVQSRLAEEAVTHLDRGKAVHQVLSEAMEKLRPDGELPREPPPRNWHPYLILHNAYLEGIPNREIISRLCTSEGTFNRTRRAALRAITRALEEMETGLT